MREGPAIYINAALSSLGIICETIDISDYSPLTFGNFVAVAETNIGRISITYDRAFHVEVVQRLPETPSVSRIADVLEQHKAAS